MTCARAGRGVPSPTALPDRPGPGPARGSPCPSGPWTRQISSLTNRQTGPAMADDERGTELGELSLDRRGLERVRAVLNVLPESTFFYREDDPDLFFFLRRYQAGF